MIKRIFFELSIFIKNHSLLRTIHITAQFADYILLQVSAQQQNQNSSEQTLDKINIFETAVSFLVYFIEIFFI